MVQGILCALFAAFFQDLGYITSRLAVTKSNDPGGLLIHSQILMGAVGLLTLPILFLFRIPQSNEFLLPLFFVTAGSGCGQYYFMRAERNVEPSRLSSMMGLRVVLLAIIANLCYGTRYDWMQWSGVLLAALSAFILNWNGRKIDFKGMDSLGIALACYCVSDLNISKMVYGFGFMAALPGAFFAMSLVNLLTGFILLPGCRWKMEMFRNSTPYAVSWIIKQFFLYMSYALIGPVHANVVLAIRGPLAVVLALLLIRMHLRSGDSAAGLHVWIRRLIATLIMTGAIILYTIA